MNLNNINRNSTNRDSTNRDSTNRDSTNRDSASGDIENLVSAKQNSANQSSVNQEYQRQLLANIFNIEPAQELQFNKIEAAKAKDIKTENAADSPNSIVTQTALNVYTNNFIENGIRALSITFETVEGFIGEDSFRMLSRRYLKYEAKTSFDWAEYGSTLPTFIAEQDALQEYPFLSEVAQLDWLIHNAQREADKVFEAASFAHLESGDTSVLRFIPAPGLQVRQFRFPVVDLYRLVHDPEMQSEENELARKTLLKEIKISISDAINNATSRSLVLWRPEYKAQFEYVSDAQAEVMQQLNEQASVDAIIETIGTHNIDLVAWLSKAISNKLIFSVA
jgi:hypothetical protein